MAQWVEPVSLTFHSVLRKLYTEPSIGASYQIAVHLATRFQRRRFFRNRPTRNKNCLWWPCLFTTRAKISDLHGGLSIDASYQVSVHLAMRFQRRRFFFRNRPIRNKNCLWRPCLLTNRAEINNTYRGPAINAAYQVSVHLAKRCQKRRIFRTEPRNKNCLWRSCLLMDQDEMSNPHRGPSIYASYHVSVHLAMQFQRRRFFLEISQSACGGHVC